MKPIIFAATTILSVSSCIPVNYNSIIWDRRSQQNEKAGVSIGAVLIDENGNALNSNIRGPWKIRLTANSKTEREIRVKSITIRTPSGAIQRFEMDQAIPMDFRSHQNQWGGYHTFSEDMIPKDAEGRATVQIEIKADGLPAWTSTFIFTSRRLEGRSTLNLLTM